MKSRITIDLDNDNQPVIKIDYVESEDVRDKMVNRFMSTFEGQSCWATFEFNPLMLGYPEKKQATVRPIPPKDVKKTVIKMVKEFQIVLTDES